MNITMEKLVSASGFGTWLDSVVIADSIDRPLRFVNDTIRSILSIRKDITPEETFCARSYSPAIDNGNPKADMIVYDISPVGCAILADIYADTIGEKAAMDIFYQLTYVNSEDGLRGI